MSKNPNQTTNKDSQKSFIVKKVAEMYGVTPRYVNYILSGDRTNAKILTSYMDLLMGSNALVEEVKKLIPFN